MSVAPPTAAAGAATGREMSDAERAHCDMVNLRVDIAQRIQAQRRVLRQRRAREAATPLVAETTGTPMSRRVRGARQIAREDVVDVTLGSDLDSVTSFTPSSSFSIPANVSSPQSSSNSVRHVSTASFRFTLLCPDVASDGSGPSVAVSR